MKSNIIARDSAVFKVKEADTALEIGSGGLKVLATPALVIFVESCSYDLLQKDLDDSKTNVGSFIEIHHIAPTLPGQEIRVELVMEQKTKSHYKFTFEIFDTHQRIAYGEHDRIIVDKVKFMQNAEQKNKS